MGSRFGQDKLWLDAESIDINSFMSVFTNRITDIYISTWYRIINSYSFWKTICYIEDYYEQASYINVI